MLTDLLYTNTRLWVGYLVSDIWLLPGSLQHCNTQTHHFAQQLTLSMTAGLSSWMCTCVQRLSKRPDRL